MHRERTTRPKTPAFRVRADAENRTHGSRRQSLRAGLGARAPPRNFPRRTTGDFFVSVSVRPQRIEAMTSGRRETAWLPRRARPWASPGPRLGLAWEARPAAEHSRGD